MWPGRSRLPARAALLFSILTGLATGGAGAVCDELGGYAIFQCADLAYFAPVPEAQFAPLADPQTGIVQNIRAVFWQIGFGNQTLNTGLGMTGTGNSGPTTFSGNDQGLFAPDLVDARQTFQIPDFPEGALCLRNNNWANAGIDGCCDNPRDPAQAFADDDILNPYYDVYAGRNGVAGLYSLDWQQDYPIAVLLTTDDGKWFAFAAVATMSRDNAGGGGNGPCHPTDPEGNPAPCDFRTGFYNFRDVADGLPNPLYPTMNNVIPWQRTPVLDLVSSAPADPGDPESDLSIEISWQPAVVHSDLSSRPSTNPALAPRDSSRAPGVGVLDVATNAGGLVRYLIEVAPSGDPDFGAPLQSLETTGNTLPLIASRLDCARVRTLLGKRPETTVTTIANCRRGMCGDLGYEVVSPRICFGGDADLDGVPDGADNCRVQPNPNQADADADGIGNACDPDYVPREDGDGVPLDLDNCPDTYNPSQADTDGDAAGNACDACPASASAVGGLTDTDGDGWIDVCDLCPRVWTTSQIDDDGDGFGVGCDNCAAFPDPTQTDDDGDGVGDVCRMVPMDPNNPYPHAPDVDGDGVPNGVDNCHLVYNPDQIESDFDGKGDACDNCPQRRNPSQSDQDLDGVGDDCDNCPAVRNPGQENQDGLAEGDACDLLILDPAEGESLECRHAPTITWTAGGMDRYRVYMAWEPDFRPEHVTTSEGWRWRSTSWKVPIGRWRRLCKKAHPSLYLKVVGQDARSREFESSAVVTVVVRRPS